MNILILGGTGMLARDLVRTAPASVSVVALSSAEADVRDETSVHNAIERHAPEWIINCAAYTAVDRAESEPSQAMAVNGEAPGIIGRAAARVGCGVVHFSSDYVFDGSHRTPYTEDDPPDPINAYGRSKLRGEQTLGASNANHLIVRTQWLFGRYGKSFVRTMWERARSGAATRVVNDQTGCASYTVDVATAVWSVVGRSGLIHIVNRGVLTWFDLAQHVFSAEERPELLTPCGTADYPTPARRPPYSALSTSRLENEWQVKMPAWQDAVDRFLVELRHSG